jgi:hypothetical protein
MAKRWQQSEVSYLQRYGKGKPVEELARRFKTDARTVKAKLAELAPAARAKAPAKPAARISAKPAAAKAAAKPAAKPSKPAAKSAAKPKAKPAPKPKAKAPAKSAVKAPAKPAAKAPAKPAPKAPVKAAAAKAATKPATKPAAKSPAKPPAKAQPKPVPKPAAKPPAKPMPATKPAAKAPVKPAVSTAAKPAAKAPAKPATMTAAKTSTPPTPQKAAPDLARAAYTEALKALHKQDWAKAVKLFEKLAVDEDRPEIAASARQYLAAARQRLDGEEEAEAGGHEDAYLKAVFEKNRGNLVTALHALENHSEDAAQALTQAVELNPKNRIHAYHDADFAELRKDRDFRHLFDFP